MSYVSAVDADGNEMAGIRPPELRAPLATFTGWNPRHPEQGAPGDLMSMMGSTLAVRAHRGRRGSGRGDPRASIEERYATRERPTWRGCAQAAGALVAARQLLAEDVDAMVERAGALWDFVCPR